jgi:hypothetical protein
MRPPLTPSRGCNAFRPQAYLAVCCLVTKEMMEGRRRVLARPQATRCHAEGASCERKEDCGADSKDGLPRMFHGFRGNQSLFPRFLEGQVGHL